jgi:hypothetical protein
MLALVASIHAFVSSDDRFQAKAWTLGTSPRVTFRATFETALPW